MINYQNKSLNSRKEILDEYFQKMMTALPMVKIDGSSSQV
jgi:hypothetical protein